MKYENLLSICIPTYNRAEVLNNTIEMWEKYIGSLPVNIYISDNASDDNTKFIVEKLIRKYGNIIYNRNSENCGYAINSHKVLSMSSAKYSWFFGDDDIVKFNDGFESFLQYLDKNNFSLLLANNKQYIPEHGYDYIYTDVNETLADIGPNISWITSLIISKKLKENMQMDKYKDRAFAHILTIFDYFSKESFCVKFYPEAIIKSNPHEDKSGAGYSSSAFTTMVVKFSKDLMMLPDEINRKSAKACIRKHNKLIYKHLIVITKRGEKINLRYYFKNYCYIRFVFPLFYRIFLFLFILSPFDMFAVYYRIRYHKTNY